MQIIRQEVPVKAIFCTGYDKRDLDVENKDGDIGQETVISKPFSISELSQKIKNTLD